MAISKADMVGPGSTLYHHRLHVVRIGHLTDHACVNRDREQRNHQCQDTKARGTPNRHGSME